MRIHNQIIITLGALALMTSSSLAGDTGVFGGWAADREDCRFVNTTVGVARDVTAGIITPKNIFFYGGECDIKGAYPKPGGYTFKGTCDEGDGAYEETMEAIQKSPNKIRVQWPGIGWTSFYRCWALPNNWEALSNR
jgi:hypothetical protein